MGSLLAAASGAFAGIISKVRTGTGFKISAGEGRIHGHRKLKRVNANIIDVKISGSDTDIDLGIVEQTGLSPKRGTPLPVHFSQDEIFYVLEGEHHFIVGSDKYQLKAGESIFLPRKIPHALTQASGHARTMVIFQPAGKM